MNKLTVVLRFTRDELLNLHRPTKVLPTLADMPDIISALPLPPVLTEPADFDEVNK